MPPHTGKGVSIYVKKSIKREFLLNRNSLWQSLAVLGGAWLLGEALSLCIMYFAHEEEYFPLALYLQRSCW